MNVMFDNDDRAESQRLREAIHAMVRRYGDSSMKTMERLPIEEAVKHWLAAERRYIALMRLTARLADLRDSTTPCEVLDFRPSRRPHLPGRRSW